MTAQNGLRQRLRHATCETHERLEQRLDIIATLADPERRAPLMRRFWGLHRGAEAVLTPLLAGVIGLDYAGRSKVALLDADLIALTGNRPDGHEPTCRFAIGSHGAGLGLAYVLEGSALGGSIIYREMLARGGSSEGLGFFNPYGSLTGARWRDFLAVLEREAEQGGEAVADDIVAGAQQAFRQIEAWLCDAAPNAR